MAAFAEFLKAIFWHGGRRWIALTLPPAIVGGIVFLGRYYQWPNNSPFAFLWNPQWWTWALAGSFGFIVAVFLAWLEQFNATRALSGRPDVTVTTSTDGSFFFILENSTNYAAVNVSAMDIEIAIPQRILDEQKKLHDVTGVPAPVEPSTKWVIKFDHVDRLTNNPGTVVWLEYAIDGVGILQRKDLQYVLSQSDKIETSLPFVLVFSNLGEPKRTWHSHYWMVYNLAKKDRLILRHLGIGEVGKDPRICSYCRKALGCE